MCDLLHWLVGFLSPRRRARRGSSRCVPVLDCFEPRLCPANVFRVTNNFTFGAGSFQDAIIRANGGTWINSGGKLEAYYGNLYGNVTNAGIFSMGAQAQTFAADSFFIWGNFTQTSGGTFKCAVGNAVNDQLNISGAATLQGLCLVSYEPGYTPSGPASWTLLTYGTVSASWNVALPAAPPGLYWDEPHYDLNAFWVNLLYA